MIWSPVGDLEVEKLVRLGEGILVVAVGDLEPRSSSVSFPLLISSCTISFVLQELFP